MEASLLSQTQVTQKNQEIVLTQLSCSAFGYEYVQSLLYGSILAPQGGYADYHKGNNADDNDARADFYDVQDQYKGIPGEPVRGNSGARRRRKKPSKTD